MFPDGRRRAERAEIPRAAAGFVPGLSAYATKKCVSLVLARLMKKHGLLLERHTGRRRPREHDGQGATIRSNCRWCSDTLEFARWNGEVVRVAFALDCHDRKAISWVAKTAGISGEMIRDMMVRCVEQRFGTLRAPHPVQWLSDNGSIFAAHRTIEIALALGLAPCFTPVESSEGNGMARLRPGQSDPECRRRSQAYRSLDGGLQHRASPLPAGLPLTPRVHPFPTRPVSGLRGSTPKSMPPGTVHGPACSPFWTTDTAKAVGGLRSRPLRGCASVPLGFGQFTLTQTHSFEQTAR